MICNAIENNLEEVTINEIQELKRKINEVKQIKICEESSLLLQIFDIELSRKIKNYTYCSK